MKFTALFKALSSTAVMLLYCQTAHAVWNGKTTAPFTVSAELRFLLSLERFLFLQVGSAGGSVDTVTFNLANTTGANLTTVAAPSSSLGTGLALPAASGGVVNVILRGNGGSVTLAASNDGGGLGLSNGAGRYLNYNQISTISSSTTLPAPVLSNAGSNSVVVNGSSYAGRVINTSATWTYSFANSAVPASGNYTGRVTYTAANP
jgi:hypothetical protein